MRLQLSLVITGLGLALTACQHQQLSSPDIEAGNPFKYNKQSAVCKVTPIVTDKDGSWKTTMTVRSDDGQCQFIVRDEDAKDSFVSFGVTQVPENGKAFIYNYNNHTYIRYTPTLAYAGADKFTASLIHKDGVKRTPITVEITVDNTGVQAPKPAVTAPYVAKSHSATKSTAKKTKSKKRVVSHTTKKTNSGN